MKIPITAASITAAAFLLSTPAPAQWLNYPSPGIPRTAGGKPNLTAPAPRVNGKIDISGIWVADTPRYLVNLAGGGSEVSFQPWAEEQYKKNKATEGRGDPEARCMPHGVPKVDTLPYPFKIFTMAGQMVFLYEMFYQYRQIFTDGREIPKEILNPSWLGYSVGKWDGDDFVVDTAGFNEKFWMDTDGHPHTDALHVTERFKRTDFGHMKIQVTIDDPKAYTKPWTNTIPLHLLPDTELLEFVCEDNHSLTHMLDKE
jgi:hypothetical protein